MRTFNLIRLEDETGISGTGRVAQGVQFDNGRVAMTWLTECSSIGIYDDIEHVEILHGHQGKTKIVFDMAIKVIGSEDYPMIDSVDSVSEYGNSSSPSGAKPLTSLEKVEINVHPVSAYSGDASDEKEDNGQLEHH